MTDIATRIDAAYPGHVKQVGGYKLGADGKVRELDIELADGTIIQVKGDRARGLNAQLSETQNAFPDDVVLGVHPDRTNRSFQHSIDAAGNTSTSNIDDLVDVVAP